MRETKWSNVVFPNILDIFWKKWLLNFHSIASLKFLEKLTVSVFCVPGIRAVDTHISCDVHRIHSSFSTSLQNSDLIATSLFTHNIVVVLSDIALKCLYFFPLQYVCTPVNFTFNPSTLMWFISSAFHLFPDWLFPSVTPHSKVL